MGAEARELGRGEGPRRCVPSHAVSWGHTYPAGILEGGAGRWAGVLSIRQGKYRPTRLEGPTLDSGAGLAVDCWGGELLRGPHGFLKEGGEWERSCLDLLGDEQ